MQLTPPESRAPPLPSTYGLTSGSFIVHAAAGDDCVARPTLFTYAEADAHLFLAQFQDLVASPLRMVKSYVLDQDKKGAGRVAHLSVTPPPNHCARPGAQLKTRRPNDRKMLNAAGTAAQLRDHLSSTKGELWRGSKVWMLDYRCSGTSLCDAVEPAIRGCSCAARVTFTATIQQVADRQVQVEVTGCDLDCVTGSLHSRVVLWDPQLLRRNATAQSKAWRGLHQAESRKADDLKLQIIKRQRVGNATSTPAATAAAAVSLEVQELSADLAEAQKKVNVMQRKAAIQHDRHDLEVRPYALAILGVDRGVKLLAVEVRNAWWKLVVRDLEITQISVL
jgi:hypothetical protein